MPKKNSETGVIDLSNAKTVLGRRRFVQAVGALMGGGLTVSQFVRRVHGSVPDGVPIIHTRGKYSEPKTVRYVPEERRRRIQVYQQLPIREFLSVHEPVNGVTMTSLGDGETEIGLKLLLDEFSENIRRVLPDEIDGVPVVYEERPREMTPQSHLRGGSKVARDSNTNIWGTATLVCYDQSTGDEVVVTADHVMEGDSRMNYDGTVVADLNERDSATDTTSYLVRNGVDTFVQSTYSIPDITGTWTFAGLTDKVGTTDDGGDLSDGDTVPVEFYGAKSGSLSDECNNTKRDDEVEYQADMVDDKTQSGDSGGPWVDANGNLLACHWGLDYYWSYGYWSLGSVGYESLEAVNAEIQ